MNDTHFTHDGPLVVACLRITDLRPEVDPLTGAVTRDAQGNGLSAADAAALELSLRIAGVWSGQVVALAVGPPSIHPVLRDVAALGATVLRVSPEAVDPDRGYAAELADDEQRLARTIVASLAPYGPPDLIMCGDRSADRGTGALPAFLAHQLGAAQALGLVALSPDETVSGDGRALIAERRLDAGWRERLEVPLPAVCSVEGAGVRLRRASLDGALAAASAPAPVPSNGISPADPPGQGEATSTVRIGPTRVFEPRTRVLPAPNSADPRVRLLALTGALVAHDPPTVIGPVGPVEAADELMAFLVRHGYLDPTDPERAGTARRGTGW
jgi:electron transfer flavoprotein beta subunit